MLARTVPVVKVKCLSVFSWLLDLIDFYVLVYGQGIGCLALVFMVDIEGFVDDLVFARIAFGKSYFVVVVPITAYLRIPLRGYLKAGSVALDADAVQLHRFCRWLAAVPGFAQ